MRTVLVPDELTADEYGTIWKGAPGADGSVVVGDLLYHDNEEIATVRFLPEEEWQAVKHNGSVSTLGGQIITDDETQDGGRLMLIRHGEVPSWMERVPGTNAYVYKDPCPACAGTGVMGGPDGYYDQPGRGKPCNTCDGRRLAVS